MKSIMKLDPFRMIRKWDPFEEIRTMQREMDRLFERLIEKGVGGEVEHVGLWTPSIESYEKDGKLVIKAELPGIDPKDLEVSITEKDVVIKGERKEEKDERKKDFTYREISYGSFERHFALPEGAKTEELKAKFDNGVLELSVPVLEAPKAKKIAVETRDVKKTELGKEVKKAA